MSEEEKVEDVQEEPEDEVHEEEMNSEEVYDSISQARVNFYHDVDQKLTFWSILYHFR